MKVNFVWFDGTVTILHVDPLVDVYMVPVAHPPETAHRGDAWVPPFDMLEEHRFDLRWFAAGNQFNKPCPFYVEHGLSIEDAVERLIVPLQDEDR